MMLHVLRSQYNNAFRMFLRLPRYCSALEMFAQTRADAFFAIIRKNNRVATEQSEGRSEQHPANCS